MTNKIFRLTFATSVLVIISCLTLIWGVLWGFFESRIEAELGSEANYIAYALQDGDTKFFDNFSDGNKSDKRITLIDKDGRVIADTDADAGSMNNHSDRAEFKSAQQDGSGISVRYSDTLTEKTVYYAKKLTDGRVLRVSTTQYTALSVLFGLIQPFLVIMIIAFVLSFFLSSRIAKSIIKPINEIDPDKPEMCDTYDELSPFLHKIINQRQTINEQLDRAKQMQDEFKLITENMNEGFLVIDKNGNLLSGNTAAMKLLDAQKTDGNVLAINRTSSFRNTVQTTLNGKRAENTMNHDGRTYNLIANPVIEKEKVIGAVIVIIDITESAKRESIRREFTANVSHELKTPLTSISGFAELMKNGGVPEETVVDFSNSIYTEAQRLISLVTDIIKISELDERNEHFVAEKVELYELSKEIIQSLKMNAEKKNISLNLIGETAQITGVKQILYEMIYNLCDNAIKYNKENGVVDVIINTADDKIKLSVRDTGIGIPQSQQDRVFERFYRVDKSRSKAEGGTGLGLSIVKHGAIYHNADISLESALGKGTAITLTFNRK